MILNIMLLFLAFEAFWGHPWAEIEGQRLFRRKAKVDA